MKHQEDARQGVFTNKIFLKVQKIKKKSGIILFNSYIQNHQVIK